MGKRQSVNIRQCTPNDAATIADIIRRAYSMMPPSQVPADMPIYHAEYHAEAMTDQQTRWLLLTDEDGPSGVAMWRALPSLTHLHLLFVVGDKHGQGYGSLLLKRFHQQAAREDPSLRLLTLHCLSDAHRSLRFYKRHGYVPYTEGDEGRVVDLYLWLDAASRYDIAWPLKKDKTLLYKLVR